jgi:hypothetical protein
MKLNLKVLKDYLLGIEVMCNEEGEDNYSEWINNNISDEDVSIRKWLDKFSEYWKEVSDDYGDSEIIYDVLVNGYNLSEDDCDIVMKEYWGEIKYYKYNYNDYKKK